MSSGHFFDPKLLQTASLMLLFKVMRVVGVISSYYSFHLHLIEISSVCPALKKGFTTRVQRKKP